LKRSNHRSDLIRGWSGSADIFGSILAGLLIGLGLDALFGTSPVFVVVLVVVAAIGAFYKSYADSERLEELAEEAIRIRNGL
jgi:F0F1-type ATP synthase assembly protein I